MNNYFNKKEINLLNKLNTPNKIQDFLNKIPFNFEEDGKQTLSSPLFTLRKNKAHCFEGALLGAFLLKKHNYPAYLLHFKTIKGDYDHIITLFKYNNFWGALSKTNHAVLRYRDPIYLNIRELVMSYFNEYYLNNGTKSLRQYSVPLDLDIFEENWPYVKGNLWAIDDELDKIKHYNIIPKNFIKKLRKADLIEIKITKEVDFITPKIKK